jgi:hypothetical protein
MMKIRPTSLPISSLADAASMGADLAMQERASYSMSTLPPSTTTGIFPPDPTLDPTISYN